MPVLGGLPQQRIMISRGAGELLQPFRIRSGTPAEGQMAGPKGWVPALDFLKGFTGGRGFPEGGQGGR